MYTIDYQLFITIITPPRSYVDQLATALDEVVAFGFTPKISLVLEVREIDPFFSQIKHVYCSHFALVAHLHFLLLPAYSVNFRCRLPVGFEQQVVQPQEAKQAFVSVQELDRSSVDMAKGVASFIVGVGEYASCC